jgi:hypothetical protein
MYQKFLGLGIGLMLSLTALGQTSDAILGTWWNAEKDGQVEVYKVGSEYRGRIVYVKENVNPDGSSPKRTTSIRTKSSARECSWARPF